MNPMYTCLISGVSLFISCTLKAQDRMGTISISVGTERRVALVVGNRDYQTMSAVIRLFDFM